MIHDLLIAPFADFGFMRRALAGILALSLGAGPVGVLIMLRRMSLMGDAMAHAILPGAAIGYLVSGLSLGAMTIGGIAAGCAVVLIAGLVSRGTVLGEDASLASAYLLSIALGVTILSMRGSQVDLFHVLFGSVLALDDPTLILLASAATLTLGGLALILKPLVIDSVDPGFLRSISTSGGPSYLIFLLLVVINLVAAFHALGTLLAVGLMVLPAAAARFWSNDLTELLGLSILAAALAGVAGLIVSFHTGAPSGPAIILAAGTLYLASICFGRHNGLIWRLLPQAHLEA